MTLLKELRDQKFTEAKSETREASRAILIDDSNLIPILFVSKHNYHKLPGGGIEADEDKVQALRREVREETGCEINITDEIGTIIEYRSAENFNWRVDLKQTSYCYLGHIIDKKNLPAFEENEIAEGFQLMWFTLEEAIKKLEDDKPNNFEGSFITERDLAFLKKAREILKVN